MAYTAINKKETIVVSSHVSELKDSLVEIAKNKKLSVTISLDETKPTAANITDLQTAVNSLEASFSNNCCQANCCQSSSCQSQTCQKCQSCQSCQSYKCQSCQR